MCENSRLQRELADKIRRIVADIQDYQARVERNPAADEEVSSLAERCVFFDHCAVPDRPFLIAGVAASGTDVCAKNKDYSVYFVKAASRLYKAGQGTLQELPLKTDGISELLWVPGEKEKARVQYLKAFCDLMDTSPEDLSRFSDYWELKGRGVPSAEKLLEYVLMPSSYDTSDKEIQLCATARLGALSRLMRSEEASLASDKPVYLLEDSTLALPLVRANHALFFEIARRCVCECARKQDFRYMTVTKTLNIPHMEKLDGEIRKRQSSDEHWFLRLPAVALGENAPGFLGVRTIPPVGAVSYLFKVGPETSPLRLDMSIKAWRKYVFSADQEDQLRRERQLFRDLDFASHDRRCYGYPYPLKAAQNRAIMTEYDQAVLRRAFVNEAVKAGLYRESFADVCSDTTVLQKRDR